MDVRRTSGKYFSCGKGRVITTCRERKIEKREREKRERKEESE
jgi:hypothetical protein